MTLKDLKAGDSFIGTEYHFGLSEYLVNEISQSGEYIKLNSTWRKITDGVTILDMLREPLKHD